MHLTKHDFNEPRHHSQTWRTVAYPTPRVRVTIQHDDCPSNPFEMDDGHWPMLVKSGNGWRHDVTTEVETGKELTWQANTPLVNWFTPEGLVHNQHAIYKLLEGSAEYVLDQFGCKHLTDPDEIIHVMEEYNPDAGNFETISAVLELAGVLTHRETVTGCSQSDWAEVLILAPRETILKLRGANVDEATVRADMACQAQLYEDWAFGNVYGYIVEVLPEAVGDPDDAIEEDWQEPDYDCWSCWGYIGDWETSGLLDQINEVLGYAPVRQMIEAHERCEAGTHSWVDDPTITDPEYACKHCGELYGEPEGASDYLTGAVA